MLPPQAANRVKHNEKVLKQARKQDLSLEDLLAFLSARYPVHFETVRLGGSELKILQLSDMPAYLDRLTAKADVGGDLRLPFWAKIWPTSLAMALVLAGLNPANTPEILEIGAGVGLCGLAAAKKGIKAVISDIEPEAVLFIRAAILKNNLSDFAQARMVDFARDRLDQRFMTIAASEVLYLEDLHEPLLEFLQAHLADDPRAQVLMACDSSRRGAGFFSRASASFRIQRMTTKCPAPDGDSRECTIYRLLGANHAPAA